MAQPQQQQSVHPPPPAVPTFRVRTMKHTGAVVFCLNQRFTTTGTYAQCDAAIDSAQQHCMLAGWWSFASVLWNPISLTTNASARRGLRRQAQQAHEYAAWWATYYGGGPHRTPVWSPPPAQPAWRRWWNWAPLAIVGTFTFLIVLAHLAHSAA
jgi:hypothetical protein